MIENHWLPRPPLALDTATLAAFEEAYQEALTAKGATIRAPEPTWAFLCWLSDEKQLLLHGSADPTITWFEPRAPRDRSADAFSKQTAVFAASDGIWATFYAVLDRRQPGMRFLNGALQFDTGAGKLSGMHYFFSVTRALLAARPWRGGTVYLLPRRGFVRQEPYLLGHLRVLEPHWAAAAAVEPLAQVSVAPKDFPFLEQVRGHDPARVDRLAATDPDGFPWL